MILYRPLVQIADEYIGDVIEIDAEGHVLQGCSFRTTEACSWEQAERMALETINWD